MTHTRLGAWGLGLGLALALLALGCGPEAKPTVNPEAPQQAFEQKMRAILTLEDQRQLRSGGNDLLLMLNDSEARVRRRTALAVGRVGLEEGVPPLNNLVTTEQDPEVRQMAVFALGLIGAKASAELLTATLTDPNPLIQGRAAEALGLIGHKPAAKAIGEMMWTHITNGALTGVQPDDMSYPGTPALEAVRLGAYALVRLSSFETLSQMFIDNGQPRSRWWPIAYAMQRVNDPRAAPVLMALLQGEGQMTRAFAAKGLGAIKHAAAGPALVAIAGNNSEPQALRIQAIRALAQIGDQRAVDICMRLVTTANVDANLQLEALKALGELHPARLVDFFIDLASLPSPAIRAAALHGLARTDVDTFLTAISSLDPDEHWSVRASLAATLGELPKDKAEAPLTGLLRDTDQRVIPAVIDALVKVKAGNAAKESIARLGADDPLVRAAAARGLGALKPAGAMAALTTAYETSKRDGLYAARTAALDAMAAVDPAAARSVVTAALADKDWAVRVHAADILKRLDAGADVSSMRPAPAQTNPDLAAVDTLVSPKYSPVAYIDTSKGTIQFELAVLDAPRTSANFVSLVKRGYFNGVSLHRVVPDFVIQDGDPRGDGEGGPGYTIRDEINQRPYLRGTVGMALDWADTGGSQFFITHSPQPHLDARYTVFGQVVSGMDVVDKLSQWDTIQRIRVWDGANWIGPEK